EWYRQSPKEYLDFKENKDYGKSISMAMKISIDRIQTENILAANLLQYIAFLWPDNIPFELFIHQARTVFNLDEVPSFFLLNGALQSLCDYSLIRQPQKNSYMADSVQQTEAIHRVTQAVILLKMESSERLQKCERVISALRQELMPESDIFNDIIQEKLN